MNARLGRIANEMRNHLNTSILAVSAIRRGSVGLHGATATALDRSLLGMRTLIDRTLADVRLKGGHSRRELIDMGAFVAEVRVAAAFEAEQKGCGLTVLLLEPGMRVLADRHILASAVTNLLQNAFKFTRPSSNVQLTAHAAKGCMLIEVEDEGDGLPEGAAGPGLSLVREGIEAQGGTLSWRNVAGRGCVFTIELPLAAEPAAGAAPKAPAGRR